MNPSTAKTTTHYPGPRKSAGRGWGSLRRAGVVNAAFAAILVILGFNTFYLYRNMLVVQQHRSLVVHTYEVLETISNLMAALKDVEGAQRGFTISGEENFLAPYNLARNALEERFQKLRAMLADNPVQTRRLVDLRSQVDEFLKWNDGLIATNRLKGPQEAQTMVKTGRGLDLMDGLRRTMSALTNEELGLLQSRSDAAENSWGIVQQSLVLVALVNVLLVAATFYFLRRFMRAQEAERERLGQENWIRTAQTELAHTMGGEPPPPVLADKILAYMATRTRAVLGAFYVREGGHFALQASWGVSEQDRVRRSVQAEEGLLGQAVRSRQVVTAESVPQGYFKMSSGLGEAAPRHLVLLPVVHENAVKGVIELASLDPFGPEEKKLFTASLAMVGVALESALSRAALQDLLEETQRQAEELQAQQEELRVSNEELENQGKALRLAKERLQNQQEELHQTNEELEQQARALEAQKEAMSDRNVALRRSQRDLEQKMRELEEASRYKSEFLANMSHELRTPLNSMLILATLLAENREGTLSDKQLDFARTIHRSGSDLLTLINDILDLSKVEAGKIEVIWDDCLVEDLAAQCDKEFRVLAETKGLAFGVEVAADAPRHVRTDGHRLAQVVKNFVSNAVKFTEKGEVTMRFRGARTAQGADALAIDVRDTGIGIAADKQELIFEAFQQGDGSTSRQFGGTGLGLTISRELAHLLGGVITVVSQPGEGSTFTVTLPVEARGESATKPQAAVADAIPPKRTPGLLGHAHGEAGQAGAAAKPAAAADAKKTSDGEVASLPPADAFTGEDRLVLIVEDDEDFGGVLLEHAHAAGFKTLWVTRGESALAVAARYPVKGVLLDIKLPDASGMSVLERLKDDPRTRHIPVHIISGVDYSQNALKMGAVGYVVKPARPEQLTQAFRRVEGVMSREVKRVLVIEDDAIQREAICQLLAGNDIQLDEACTGAEAQAKLEAGPYDCLIVDLRLPDMSGLDLLRAIAQNPRVQWTPVVVYTGQDLSKEEEASLRRYSESIIIKGARSPERLLDEVTLFLHRVESQMPPDTQAILQSLRTREKHLEGRRVLLVDDDMRNVFALTSALENHGLKVAVAKNGKEAVDFLGQAAGTVDLVLMDIMMPLMDGYDATRLIRKDKRFEALPIIALTAKAMRGDQEKCLAAGANDYLPKPIDLGQLLSLLRVWMPRDGEV